MALSEDDPVLTISAAAKLAGMHAQTLRQYDRLGLVVPQRTRGGGRRYCLRDVANLLEVQRLSADEGINLAGIKRILDLESEVRKLRQEAERLRAELDPGYRVFAADASGAVISLPRGQRPVARRRTITARSVEPGDSGRGALILWRQR